MQTQRNGATGFLRGYTPDLLMKKLSLLFLFMMLFLRAAACEEAKLFRDEPAPGGEHDQTEFRQELSLSARKAVELARRRFSKIKSINDSYQLTAEAILLLADRGDIDGAVPLLREASKKFDGNRLAYLLLGAALERTGALEEAARAYAGFYRNSLTLGREENKVIGPSALQVFREYVEARFAAWKIPLPPSKIGFDLRRERSMAMLEGSPAGQRINLILPLVVVGGLLVLILFRLTGAEFPSAVSYFFVNFYVLCVLAYALWAAHLFLGLPFFVSPVTEYKLFFIGGALLIVAFYAARRFLGPKMRKKIEGARYCPFCGAIMLDVERECPECKRRTEE
jgi:tetratricopeptide (TPR) repeat protein